MIPRPRCSRPPSSGSRAMNWPSPKDFNEAVRNPSAAFADPDLAAGDPVVGPGGRPTPQPGDASSVYQICAEDGRAWAVKCFTRAPRPARYTRLQEALTRAALPSTTNF